MFYYCERNIEGGQFVKKAFMLDSVEDFLYVEKQNTNGQTARYLCIFQTATASRRWPDGITFVRIKLYIPLLITVDLLCQLLPYVKSRQLRVCSITISCRIKNKKPTLKFYLYTLSYLKIYFCIFYIYIYLFITIYRYN